MHVDKRVMVKDVQEIKTEAAGCPRLGFSTVTHQKL